MGIQQLSKVDSMDDSTTITIRVAKSVKERLENLAKETKRSRSALAAEGVAAFVEIEERQIEGIKQALGSIDRDLGVVHDEVKNWIASWDTENEVPTPKAAKT
jgi:RHH-type rel operon transcriptional repressor/antitoxin RelB